MCSGRRCSISPVVVRGGAVGFPALAFPPFVTNLLSFFICICACEKSAYVHVRSLDMSYSPGDSGHPSIPPDTNEQSMHGTCMEEAAMFEHKGKNAHDACWFGSAQRLAVMPILLIVVMVSHSDLTSEQ